MERTQQGGNKVNRTSFRIALARALGGVRTFLALSNRVQATNPSSPAASGTVAFAQSITPTVSGHVALSGTISGTLSAIDLGLTIQYLRNFTPIGPAMTVPGGHAGADQFGGGTLPTWVDTNANPLGVAIAYSIQVTTTSGTFTLPIGGASLTLVEQPS